jgi:outer membrane protein assembly factor BamD (BamD/ComL family)
MAQRLALIIGNGVYLDGTLSRLLTPDADVGALGELLLDPERGGFDDVKVMVNMSSHIIRRAIASFFSKKSRDDLLLLYFSGHGVLDDQGQLFLAVRDTDSRLLSGTGIPASYITNEMNTSHSQRQVLMLDCCHSGAFARGSKSQIGASVGTAAVFEGTGYGRVVLTASDATQFAWEGEQVIGRAENSLFTHYLVEGIQTGKADLDSDGQITVDELYDYTYEQVIRQTPKQTPGKWSYKEQGEIVLSRAPSSTSIGSLRVKIPDLEQDQEAQLDQLYNEGLSAFWLEEWDKAVRCFEALVEIRGDFLDAVNKLEQSRRNKRLLALYNQAVAAEEAGEWSQAIARLEELTSIMLIYKDAAARLEKARRARQLDNLYQEAKQLSQAEKWQAVVNVFSKIADLKPDYPDPDGLLPAARLKVAEIERRQIMDSLYQRALREMDASHWDTARQLLLDLENMETGYRGADRLLAKLDTKIAEQQAIQQRAERLASLYEQALVLDHARQWSQALEKIGEIRELDAAFADPEGIEPRAQTEIEREKAEARRQLQLNARYAQAVQLLQAGQYQQALEQWGHVQALEPAYPDRQKVQATARKKLKELTQVSVPKRQLPRWAITTLSLAGIVALILILTYPGWIERFTQPDGSGVPAAAVPAASQPTRTSIIPAGINRLTPVPEQVSAPTRTPHPTATSRPPATKTRTEAPPPAIVFPIIDDFDNPLFNGRYNPELWSIEKSDPSNMIAQQDGVMVLSGDNRAEHEMDISLIAARDLPLSDPYSLEAQLMVDVSSYGTHLGLFFELPNGNAECQIQAGSVDEIACWTYFSGINQALPRRVITPGSWHTIRIDFMIPHEFDFYIDQEFIGTIQPEKAGINQTIRSVFVHLIPYTEKVGHGYINDFSFGPIDIP